MYLERPLLLVVNPESDDLIGRLRDRQTIGEVKRGEFTPVLTIPRDWHQRSTVAIPDVGRNRTYGPSRQGDPYLAPWQYRTIDVSNVWSGDDRTVDPADLCFFVTRDDSTHEARSGTRMPPVVFALRQRHWWRQEYFDHQEIPAAELWGPNGVDVIEFFTRLERVDDRVVRALADQARIAEGVSDVWTSTRTPRRPGEITHSGGFLPPAPAGEPFDYERIRPSVDLHNLMRKADPRALAVKAGFENRWEAMRDMRPFAGRDLPEEVIERAHMTIATAARAMVARHVIPAVAYAAMTEPARSVVGDLDGDEQHLDAYLQRLVQRAGIGRVDRASTVQLALDALSPTELVERASHAARQLAQVGEVARSYSRALRAARRLAHDEAQMSDQTVDHEEELLPPPTIERYGQLVVQAVAAMEVVLPPARENEVAWLIRNRDRLVEGEELPAVLADVESLREFFDLVRLDQVVADQVLTREQRSMTMALDAVVAGVPAAPAAIDTVEDAPGLVVTSDATSLDEATTTTPALLEGDSAGSLRPAPGAIDDRPAARPSGPSGGLTG